MNQNEIRGFVKLVQRLGEKKQKELYLMIRGAMWVSREEGKTVRGN